jgi:hypothetical protein
MAVEYGRGKEKKLYFQLCTRSGFIKKSKKNYVNLLDIVMDEENCAFKMFDLSIFMFKFTPF